VPGFTFARGNAQKLLSLPLYALGAVATAVVPRRANLWVFGCGSGIGEGALELFRYVRQADAGIAVVWLARDSHELAAARELGLPAVLRSSWRGFRSTLRARVAVVTHGFGDVNRFGVRGAFVVQLWHGIPLKRIQLDSPVTFPGPLGSVLKRLYRRNASRIGLLPAASELSAARLRTAFGLPSERVAVTGDPRDDVLLRGMDSERRATARTLLSRTIGDVGDSRVVLYAPTWRDGESDPGVPNADEWRMIGDRLEAEDSLLVLRPHPHSVGEYRAGVATSPRIRMLDAASQNDVTPVLPAVDILVTDYSSIAYDFALTGRPIAFLAPDVERYSAARGLYQPYDEFSGGTAVTTWPALLELIGDESARQRLADHSRALAQTVHAFHDGRNTERVYEEIITPSGKGSMTAALQPTFEVTAARLSAGSDPALVLEGSGRLPAELTLVGSRRRLRATVTTTDEGWRATIPLVAARWGGPALPPPSGRYRVRDENGVLASAPAGPEQSGLVERLFRYTVGDAGGALAIDFTAPLLDGEHGPEQQARLEAAYRTSDAAPQNAVFFESFFGQNASCNPLAIDRALASARPEIPRYWGVADASVEVPPGAIAVIEGSADWWRIRASARLIVINDWLRNRYRKRRGQTVLQTWHGTMLKKLALSRSGLRPRAALATLRERSRWSILLSQNRFATGVFRRAYAFLGPVWEEGYPRDDVLVNGDATVIRAKLGIPADAKVLLYAPTWRDDRPDHVDHLDVSAFTKTLGDDYVMLIRGHSRTLQPGADLHAGGVLDVTSYPDVSELFLVADALITDYSSVMFDFSVTGKPIFFFTPDLDRYRQELRGFYFDLVPVAPGPIVRTPAELAALIAQTDAVRAEYAGKYAAWRERYNPMDDGAAAERVVARLLREGIIG
jgi:CDP-glycerol glycerophosphotransferase